MQSEKPQNKFEWSHKNICGYRLSGKETVLINWLLNIVPS